jgi:hypothetical protein
MVKPVMFSLDRLCVNVLWFRSQNCRSVLIWASRIRSYPNVTKTLRLNYSVSLLFPFEFSCLGSLRIPSTCSHAMYFDLTFLLLCTSSLMGRQPSD